MAGLFDHSLQFSFKRSCAVLLVGLAIVAILIWQAAIPVRNAVADRYVARGDAYFIQLQFEKAESEYRKAVYYNSDLVKAQERQNVATDAVNDIVSARSLFQELKQNEKVIEIDRATADYAAPKEALQAGITFYEDADYALARYPFETAIKLDPDYPDAWNYLAMTYDKLAHESAIYRQKAVDARAKRDALTPKWIGQ